MSSGSEESKEDWKELSNRVKASLEHAMIIVERASRVITEAQETRKHDQEFRLIGNCNVSHV